MSVGEAGAETGEGACGSEAYTFSPNEEAGGEATAPTVLPLPSRTKGSIVCVRFGGAGRDEDRLNKLVKGT
jgi:hypothetical protein